MRTTPPCQVEPELWFSEGLEEAKSRCRGCPLSPMCLQGAIDRAEPWGVWGGEILQSGQVIARKRVRGRPRRDVAA